MRKSDLEALYDEVVMRLKSSIAMNGQLRQERNDARAQLAAVREDLEEVRKVRDEAIKARDDARGAHDRRWLELVAVRRERDEARAKLAKLLERMSTAVAELDAPDPDDAPAKAKCPCAFCNPYGEAAIAAAKLGEDAA